MEYRDDESLSSGQVTLWTAGGSMEARIMNGPQVHDLFFLDDASSPLEIPLSMLQVNDKNQPAQVGPPRMITISSQSPSLLDSAGKKPKKRQPQNAVATPYAQLWLDPEKGTLVTKMMLLERNFQKVRRVKRTTYPALVIQPLAAATIATCWASCSSSTISSSSSFSAGSWSSSTSASTSCTCYPMTVYDGHEVENTCEMSEPVPFCFGMRPPEPPDLENGLYLLADCDVMPSSPPSRMRHVEGCTRAIQKCLSFRYSHGRTRDTKGMKQIKWKQHRRGGQRHWGRNYRSAKPNPFHRKPMDGYKHISVLL